MTLKAFIPRCGLAAALALFACSSLSAQTTPAPATPTPQAPPAAAQPPPQSKAPLSPVEQLIAQVEEQYARGDADYQAGHLEAAKQAFDQAFDLLLMGPIPIHSDERLEREFDKLVEAVHNLEMQALKQGDGFTEQRSEPAPIDEANELTFPADPAVTARARAGLGQTHSDLPLEINDYVAGYISFFSNTKKGHYTALNSLNRAGRYREMIERVLREEGVPQDLIYLAQAESGFRPLALSRAGARGMWQFVAARASGYGLQRNWWLDERQDPEKSTRAAARHLKDLYNMFGDWYLAMAAYNSGPLTIQRAVERTGYADYWELLRRDVLPRETRNYVPIILAMTIVGKNPAQYGIDQIAPETPPQVDTVHLNYPVDLRLAAECAETTVDTLQDLNPSLLRMTTPKDMEFDLHLPAGSAERYATAIAAIPADMRTWWRYHRVQGEETLAEIARKYHTTESAIAEVNNLEKGAPPQKDARLIIPVPAGHTEDENITYSKRPVRYRVRKGDTVLSVADDYGVPVERLRRWNRLKGNTLTPGRYLTIYRPLPAGRATESAGTKKSAKGKPAASKAPAPAGASHAPAAGTAARPGGKAPAASAAPARIHTVRPGETLSSIASRYGTTVAALQRDNHIASARNLRPGQKLVIKSNN